MTVRIITSEHVRGTWHANYYEATSDTTSAATGVAMTEIEAVKALLTAFPWDGKEGIECPCCGGRIR